MNYLDIYKRRLNRYGNDYQSRVQGTRERTFRLYLNRSVYRVDLNYEGREFPASFEKYKQDETETMHYLLTETDVVLPNGSVLMIPNVQGEDKPWMVYYLEQIKASGYNRYIMLRMTHKVKWLARDEEWHESWAYMYGQENNMLKDEIRSRSRMDTIYAENLKASFFIMPRNEFLKKDSYFIVGEKPFEEYYRITGYDIQSSEGIEYVTIDPVYEFDLSLPPEQDYEVDKDEDYFWFNGGVE